MRALPSWPLPLSCVPSPGPDTHPSPIPQVELTIQYLLLLGGPHFLFVHQGLGLALLDEQAVLGVRGLSFASRV